MGYIPSYSPINDYLNRGKQFRDKVKRRLSADELEWINTIRVLNKEINVLIVEMITVREVLEAINEPKIFYVSQNFRRIIFSLIRQRDFMSALRHTIMSTIPKPEEIPDILNSLKKIRERIIFLRKTVIPENLQLTPIQEYVEIIGDQDFIDDIRRRFDNTFSMYEANTGKNEEIKTYAADILLTVHDKGLDDRYKARLQKYIEAEDNRIKKAKLEKQKAMEEKDILTAKYGMEDFREMFYEGLRTLNGNDKIMMSSTSVYAKIKNGRNVFVILCCYTFHRKAIYRYVGMNNEIVKKFSSARIFKDKSEAYDVLSEMEKAYPSKIFDVTDLGGQVRYA